MANNEEKHLAEFGVTLKFIKDNVDVLNKSVSEIVVSLGKLSDVPELIKDQNQSLLTIGAIQTVEREKRMNLTEDLKEFKKESKDNLDAACTSLREKIKESFEMSSIVNRYWVLAGALSIIGVPILISLLLKKFIP